MVCSGCVLYMMISTPSSRRYPQRGPPFESLVTHFRLAHGKNKSEWIEIYLPKLDYARRLSRTVTIACDNVSKKWSAIFAHAVSCVDAMTVSKEMPDRWPHCRRIFLPSSHCVQSVYKEARPLAILWNRAVRTALTGIKQTVTNS